MLRTLISGSAIAWSRTPEGLRRVVRPVVWRLPLIARLRGHARELGRPADPEAARASRGQDAVKRLARLRVWYAVRDERTRARFLVRLARFAAREPGTLLRAVSLADVAKLAGRLVAPATNTPPTVTETWTSPLEIEARAVAELFGRPIALRDVKPIEFPHFDEPEVSFVIPVWNRWHFTYKCLAAIAENANGLAYEVVVVDNGSTDETREILEKTHNLNVVRNEENLGFLRASNAGALAARGKYVLFLNNDAHILSGTVRSLLSALRSDPSIGAVGGRLIFLDGRLQEAGSIVWRDGSCLGYGRGDDPFDPRYSHVRDVDYCSAALLLTPREVFVKVGMFDERYAPAYYEDADYCMALRSNGYRVLYQPAAVVVHHEYGSSPRREGAIAAQVKNQRVFVEKWSSVLASHVQPSLGNVLLARDARRRPRLLFVDDRVPDPRLGSGYPRTHRMLISAQELGWAVTFFALQDPERLEPCTSELEARGIEVITGPAGRKLDLKRFLEQRPGHYDVVLISRPHNMSEVAPFVRDAAPGARLVYDAEAIYAQRDLQKLRLEGATVNGATAETMIRDEMELVRPADAIIAASPVEARTFREFGAPGTHVVGHCVEVRPTPTPFSERKDLLFVGAVLTSPSPNEDAVLYFVREVLPLIRRRLQCTLFVVGTNRSPAIAALDSPAVRVIGTVDDLAPWYARARAFVVPTRYAAGIPIKLYGASASGLPSVVTPLIVNQVGWTEGRDLLVGADPEDFARRVVELYSDEALWERIRLGALEAVRRDCSEEAFLSGLAGATASQNIPRSGESSASAHPVSFSRTAIG